MSIDGDTLRFLERLDREPEMRAALEAALAGADDPLAEVVEFASAQGFSVDGPSPAAVREAIVADEGRFEDSQLEGVAGGIEPLGAIGPNMGPVGAIAPNSFSAQLRSFISRL